MKFVPIVTKLCGVVAIQLLSGCALSASEVVKNVEPTISVRDDALPKPTQTTWSTPEPTSIALPTKGVPPESPASVVPQCEGVNATIWYRFKQSGMDCKYVIALRNALLQMGGEDELDTLMLKYHSLNCTENGGKGQGEPLPYDPSKKIYGGEELLYKVKPGESKSTEGETLRYDLGKSVPCRTPKK